MEEPDVTMLANAIRPALDHLLNAKSRRRGVTFSLGPEGAPVATDVLARELAEQAKRVNAPFANQTFEFEDLGGGNTAEKVAIMTIASQFVLKADSKDQKLVREAKVMQQIRGDMDYPQKFREAVPVIYAVRETPPYAYLMEYFPRSDKWRSLEDRLYPPADRPQATQADAVRLMDAALDILFAGYSAKQDNRRPPSINVDYVGRIRDRLTKVASIDDRFASRPLVINGTPVDAWGNYLDLLANNENELRSLGPDFSTVVHGDPNPGNIMLSSDVSSIQVKLIDPKDWGQGDYLFDIAKITHFLLATGPIEKPASGGPTKATYFYEDAIANLSYEVNRPDWTHMLVEACLNRAGQFAEEHGDEQWRARYELGMAANILGLPDGRLQKKREDAALALFGEGLLWLDRFCRRLSRQKSLGLPPVERLETAEVEPGTLATARAFVRARVAGVVDAEDRRGFPLLHWSPVRPNARGKPVELSLEHEARLMALDTEALRTLQAALPAAPGGRKRLGDALLPNHPRFADMLVERVDREPGPQSVDRYWDITAAILSGQGLIARNMSFRERVRTSDFMTWAESDTDQRALNFELPVVALGPSGVVARLEFNWIDEVSVSFAALGDGEAAVVRGDPVALVNALVGLQAGSYEPVIEHTTFREKFIVYSGDGAEAQLHLNIDHITAQSLQYRRIANYVDIDIAAARRVGPDNLAELIAFVEAVKARYRCVPIPASKAWRDAQVLNIPIG